MSMLDIAMALGVIVLVILIVLRKKGRGNEHHKSEQREMSVSHGSLACPGQRMGA